MSMSELDDQIAGIGQLGNVVHAMTGIASARARTANGQLSAVDSYAATLRAAWQQVQIPQHKSPPNRATVILFCAEQGFVGDFSQKVLNVLQGPNTVDLSFDRHARHRDSKGARHDPDLVHRAARAFSQFTEIRR
jgi:F0F1-type ATP synthase gamma subunit